MRNLLTSILNFVLCDRVVQRAYYIQFTESPGVSKPISVPLGGSKNGGSLVQFFATNHLQQRRDNKKINDF